MKQLKVFLCFGFLSLFISSSAFGMVLLDSPKKATKKAVKKVKKTAKKAVKKTAKKAKKTVKKAVKKTNWRAYFKSRMGLYQQYRQNLGKISKIKDTAKRRAAYLKLAAKFRAKIAGLNKKFGIKKNNRFALKTRKKIIRRPSARKHGKKHGRKRARKSFRKMTKKKMAKKIIIMRKIRMMIAKAFKKGYDRGYNDGRTKRPNRFSRKGKRGFGCKGHKGGHKGFGSRCPKKNKGFGRCPHKQRGFGSKGHHGRRGFGRRSRGRHECFIKKILKRFCPHYWMKKLRRHISRFRHHGRSHRGFGRRFRNFGRRHHKFGRRGHDSNRRFHNFKKGPKFHKRPFKLRIFKSRKGHPKFKFHKKSPHHWKFKKHHKRGNKKVI